MTKGRYGRLVGLVDKEVDEEVDEEVNTEMKRNRESFFATWVESLQGSAELLARTTLISKIVPPG